MKWIGMLGLLSCLVVAQPALADVQSHKKAAEELLEVMKVQETFEQSIDEMLKVQLKANPGMEAFEPVLRKFFKKYMGWKTLKGDLVKLYLEEFSEKELRELVAFYRTKIGQKAATRMPALMSKGAEIGQNRVQEHMPELMQMMQEAAQKKQAK